MRKCRPRLMLLLVPVAACAGVGTGCAGPLNNDLAIGHSVELSTLRPDERLAKPGAKYNPDPPPSLVGISRENWKPISFNVPVDVVDHYATSSVQANFNDDNLRQTGGFPTEASVLELTSGRGVANQALEGVASPFYSALDILMAFPRGIVQPPWEVTQSPQMGIQRTPATTEIGERPAPATPVPVRPETK